MNIDETMKDSMVSIITTGGRHACLTFSGGVTFHIFLRKTYDNPKVTRQARTKPPNMSPG